MTDLFGCQQNLLDEGQELAAILEYLCSEANDLYNCGVYYARQLWFKSKKFIGKYELDEESKNNRHFKALYSQVAQQTLRSVFEAFQGYKELRKLWFARQLETEPRPPKYRKPNGLAPLTYPKQALRLDGKQIKLPLGRTVKCWFALNHFYLPMASNLNFSQIKELRIVPRNNCFYAEFVYELETVSTNLDRTRALGIDHGVDNWLTCVSTEGDSFLIDGKRIKSWNQYYNKFIATYKQGKPQGFWNNKLAHLTEKRNRRMRDAVNKAASYIMKYCLKHKLGTIVMGWNKGQKDKINIGGINNQKFVQLPTAKLKERIKELSELYGIQFVETEESYTSQSSFLDDDFLPEYGARPKEWKASGTRKKRHYLTARKWLLNSDAHGAANILRKVSTELGLILTKVCRRCLTSVARINLYSVSKRIP